MLIEDQNYFSKHPVILFDGVCGLCNSFVNLIIKLDKQELYRYAPLQSKTAIELRKKYCRDVGDIDTIILIEDGCHTRASAIRMILRRIRKLYLIYRLSTLIPAYFINIFYNIIARNRYKVFGKYETCRIPTEREKKLFLD